ncbi:MAG TPA: hypothetical protein VFL91_09035, partial [Thermomicrobiales bacterium]|nr:hypothetical protein [Thermomicrobiales bacterium]
RLLDAAGWARGADGLRRRAGQPLALTLLAPAADPATPALVERLRGQFAAVGAALTAREAPAAALLAADGPARAGRFDLLLTDLRHGPDPLPALRAHVGCYAPTPIASVAPGPANYGHWCDPATAARLDAATGAATTAGRAAAVRAVLDLIAAEAALLPLLTRSHLLVRRDPLRGVAPARWAPPTWNAGAWWRAPARG